MEIETPIKARAGRKTKYSPALISKLLSYTADGLNNKQACAAVGIGETTLREWRAEHAGLEEKLEAAREILRSKVLAKIKAAGATDWRALAEFVRLAFPELRFGNGPSVNVAIQQNNMALSDPERAALIQLRENALAHRASQPLQLEDARDARAIALEAERNLADPQATPEPPKPLMPPKSKPITILERADDQMRSMKREDWKASDAQKNATASSDKNRAHDHKKPTPTPTPHR